MKTFFHKIVAPLIFSAAVAWAMTEALGDPAVGIALGAAMFIAMQFERRRCGRD